MAGSHRSCTPDHNPLGIVLALTEDEGNNVWAAVIRTPPGRPTKLICFRDGNYVKEISDPRLDVVSLAADPLGGFWLGLLQGGLARYRSDQVQVFPLKDAKARVSQVLVNSDGSVLVATNNGLVEQRGDSQRYLDVDTGLPCNRIFALVADKHSDLWLYAECGLIKIKSENLQRWHDDPNEKVKFDLFDAFDGAQPYLPPFRPIATRSNDGRLWFANDTVAQMIDPDGLLRNPIPPPVHIEDVRADRKTYSPQNGLRLPALTRDLEIDYTALSFVVPQKVHFQYKLEGYDREWQDAGTRRQAFYTNLPPRSYTYRVKACNNSGVWNEAGASLDFFVTPAYYQTNWFRFLCVAAFIALFWALHRWRVYRLISQEKHLRDVVETIPAMTFTALSNGSTTFVNKRWTEYTGLSVEESSGTGWHSAIHAEDLGRNSEKWRVSVVAGGLFEDEARFRRALDGQYRWFLVRGVPLRDPRGKIVRWYGTLTDIEDRKRAEKQREKLRQLEDDLAHINRVSMLGEMAASLSHEIKQPIAAAMTSANSCIEWLAHEPPNLDRARAAAAKIDKYGNRAAQIIDHIRSLYRKSPPRSELIDGNEIVHEILPLLQDEAIRYSIAMRPELADELPRIKADRVQLQQVFMNLMLNAVEAMRDDGGELTVKSQLQDGQLQFSVSDTGPGLPNGNVDEIFSAFFTTKPQGSGMGLAISRSIVESHGGRLWATANDGRGATFNFTLPTEVT
jgi:PAS domain S-box-containing protein